ncbi:VanZ family protein [Desulfofustis glycolicus]|nr:VanZ family protein [Desulfofustis glycolicus]
MEKTKTAVGAIVQANWRLVFLLVILPGFFFAGFGGNDSRVEKELFDFGHVVFFAVFASELFRQLVKRGWKQRPAALLVAVLVCLAALSIEISQAFLDGRQAGVRDFVYGLVGGCAVLVWKMGEQRGVGMALRRGIVVGVVAWCLFPLVCAVIDEYRMYRGFPVLADFESSLELSRWQSSGEISRVTDPVQSGAYSLKVLLDAGVNVNRNRVYVVPVSWRWGLLKRYSVFPEEGCRAVFGKSELNSGFPNITDETVCAFAREEVDISLL